MSNSVHINKGINEHLDKIYKNLDLKDISFDTFKEYDKNIFGLFTEQNINEFITNYNEVDTLIPYRYWKDIIFLYKVDEQYRNKYIYNLLSDNNKILFRQSLELITRPTTTDKDGWDIVLSDDDKDKLKQQKHKYKSILDKYNLTEQQIKNNPFREVPFEGKDLVMDDNNIIYNYMKNILTIILTIMDNKIQNIAKINIDEINQEMLDKKFFLILHKDYSLKDIKDLTIVKYYDVNLTEKELKLNDYLYYICLYFLILFKYSNYDLNQYLINENKGYASNIREYDYNNYKILSNILSEQFQDYLSKTNQKSLLSYDNNIENKENLNLNSLFITELNLPNCINNNLENELEKFEFKDILINDLDITKLINNNLDFKINNLWFNKFSKIPCNKETETVIQNSGCDFFPHFIKSVIKKDVLNNIEILDLDTDIKNNYLKWYYKPTILGPLKYKFGEIRECSYINRINNYNLLYIYKDVEYEYNPFHLSLYYDKLWIQLLCYRTSPNGFLNDILDESIIIENSNNYFNKYSNMAIKLTHLFPFVYSINVLYKTLHESDNIKYYKLDLDIESYYTIENINDYDYLGYLYIPFNKDSRNIRKDGDENLFYYLFKNIKTNLLLISNHRNKIYSFFQKESPQLSIMEFNVIGYLNNWNKRYTEWHLYPYLVIYTSKYKYYNNQYQINDSQKCKTNIYISTLKYEELLDNESKLNNRLYKDEINNDNIKIQLEIPNDEDLIDIKKNIHLYIIPIIPILSHQNIKFVCPIQKEYIIKDYQSLIETQSIQKVGGDKNDYFNKYLKYKLKYNKLVYVNSKQTRYI